MIISRFGLHVAPGNIPFLIQGTGVTNLISPDLHSPFELHVRPRGTRCPHDIDISQEVGVPDWIDHPLVQPFLPIPRVYEEKPSWLYDPEGVSLEIIDALSRLSSPTGAIRQPLWWRATNRDTFPYHRTNLGPLIWTGATVKQTQMVEKQFQLADAHERRALIVAEELLPFAWKQRVELFDLDLNQPFEAIGATILRRHMQEISNV